MFVRDPVDLAVASLGVKLLHIRFQGDGCWETAEFRTDS